MGFSSFADYRTKVVDAGQAHTSTFRKTPGVATVGGIWFDLSVTPGHPVTNFYASSPLIAATLLAREGIQHGSDVSPKQKYLKRLTVATTSSLVNFLIADLLIYYPFIDGDNTDVQLFDNTVTLPRYTTGQGVQAFVVAQGAYTGGAQFFIKYTNQDGVSGRVSLTCTSNTAATPGHLITSGTTAGAYGWNIPLAQGDTGIRSVQEFTFLTANGGIFALVLCVGLGTHCARELNVPAEKDFLLESGLAMPEVKDGAFLSLLALPNTSLNAAPVYGSTQFVWG